MRPGGEMAVGLGLAADDRDRGVGQAGEIARQVAHVDAAAVFIVGEVAHVVQAVLDVPVVADQGRELLRTVLFFSLFQWILPNYSMNSSGRCSNWFTTAGEN